MIPFRKGFKCGGWLTFNQLGRNFSNPSKVAYWEVVHEELYKLEEMDKSVDAQHDIAEQLLFFVQIPELVSLENWEFDTCIKRHHQF